VRLPHCREWQGDHAWKFQSDLIVPPSLPPNSVHRVGHSPFPADEAEEAQDGDQMASQLTESFGNALLSMDTTESNANSTEFCQNNVIVRTDPSKRNPLRWFGVLTPSSLRQSQSKFIQGTLSLIV
jgi:hypothetical protein